MAMNQNCLGIRHSILSPAVSITTVDETLGKGQKNHSKTLNKGKFCPAMGE
jgi:hypothetical protein